MDVQVHQLREGVVDLQLGQLLKHLHDVHCLNQRQVSVQLSQPHAIASQTGLIVIR